MRATKIYRYEKDKKIRGKRVVALGLFDGVHLGHRQILAKAVLHSKRLGIPAAVFTFDLSARLKDGSRIYTDFQRMELLSECGIDEIIVARFEDISSESAERFASDILQDQFGCTIAVSGNDFRFGKGALGNTDMLRTLMSERGGMLDTVDDVCINGLKISSSVIKSLIAEGKVKEAGEMLGKPYYLFEKTVHGLGLGKSFGFPTVNTELPSEISPIAAGVYKTECDIDGRLFRALTNIGTCPTVGGRERHAETFILGDCGDLYDKKIRINFIDYLRTEIRFSSIEELKKQINVDINTAYGTGEDIWQEIGQS